MKHGAAEALRLRKDRPIPEERAPQTGEVLRSMIVQAGEMRLQTAEVPREEERREDLPKGRIQNTEEIRQEDLIIVQKDEDIPKRMKGRPVQGERAAVRRIRGVPEEGQPIRMCAGVSPTKKEKRENAGAGSEKRDKHESAGCSSEKRRSRRNTAKKVKQESVPAVHGQEITGTTGGPILPPLR